MTKEPSVSVREVLDELRYGKGLTLPQSQRDVTDQTIVRIVNYLKAKKGAKQVTPRAARKSSQLMTLEQWEKSVVYGPLDVPLIDTWATRSNLCKRQLAELIEEFRTEMIAKNKHYADFAAAFNVYLNKGYLSKKLEQIKLRPGEGKNKWGNSTATRGLSL
jgi:hypothetical protein